MDAPDDAASSEELVDEELEDEELEEEEIEDGLDEVDPIVTVAADDAEGDDEDEDEDEEAPAAARAKAAGDEDEEDDDDLDPDDVEADLDAILKDRIAAADDDEEDEDSPPEDRSDPDNPERVAAKSAEEFTCSTCFMIVHPRQFGRPGQLTCPEGYDPCPSVAKVEKRFKKSGKK